MNDDYLWDRSGHPDPEIERLERLLARFRRRGEPEGRPAGDMPPHRRMGWPSALAVAAIAMLALGVAALGPVRWTVAPVSEWTVAALDGTPRLAASPLADGSRLPVGSWLETDHTSAARLDIPEVGRLVIGGDSRVRVVRSGPGDHRLEMTRGTLDAFVWAPPGQLSVATPAATAVDLGCAYTLTTSETGDGRLSVSAGWVGLRYRGREAFVPAGASVRIRAVEGPGTPTLNGSAELLRVAIDTFDAAGDAADAQRGALQTILSEARAGDALTLWHLLDRVATEHRGRVHDALAALVPPPDSITRRGIIEGDALMREAWWSALGHGDVGWWRLWQRDWAPRQP